MNDLRKFVSPEFIFGSGSLSLIGQYIDHLGGNRILLVTDQGIKHSGWCEKVESHLRDRNVEYVVYDNVLPNPRDEQVMEGEAFYRKNRCDVILAIGGGSVLDAAKGIGIVTTNGGHILDFAGIDRISSPIPPLICVPTTCGSSADVSQFAIITDTKNRKKVALVSKALVPDISLIDPETLTTMDHLLLEGVSLDTLTHAVEAYVSTAHSFMTDRHALGAIEIIGQFLLPSLADPKNLGYLTWMMQASLEAGLAFSNASLGMVHAMAHVMGGLKDFPHGECNGILLREVCRYNYSVCSDRYDRIAGILASGRGGKPKPGIEGLEEELDRLVEGTGLNEKQERFALTKEECRTLASLSLKDICSVTNPKEPKEDDIAEIYERLFLKKQ